MGAFGAPLIAFVLPTLAFNWVYRKKERRDASPFPPMKCASFIVVRMKIRTENLSQYRELSLVSLQALQPQGLECGHLLQLGRLPGVPRVLRRRGAAPFLPTNLACDCQFVFVANKAGPCPAGVLCHQEHCGQRLHLWCVCGYAPVSRLRFCTNGKCDWPGTLHAKPTSLSLQSATNAPPTTSRSSDNRCSQAGQAPATGMEPCPAGTPRHEEFLCELLKYATHIDCLFSRRHVGILRLLAAPWYVPGAGSAATHENPSSAFLERDSWSVSLHSRSIFLGQVLFGIHQPRFCYCSHS